VVTGYRGVRLLNAHTGRTLHTINASSPFASLSPGGHPGQVWVGNGGGGISILDVGSGRVVGALQGSLALDALVAGNHRLIAVDDSANAIRVLDARSGAVLRSLPVGVHPIAAALELRTGRLFVINTGSIDMQGQPTTPATLTILDGLAAPPGAL